MYTGDTVIYNTAKDQLKISNTLTKELAIMNQWLLENTLFAQGKTECVLFGTIPRLACTNNFIVGIDNFLKRVSQFKYLGVVLDQCLTKSEHVKYLVGKVSKRISLYRRTRNNLSLYTANVIYKSLILPIINYCDNVWGCCGKVNSDKSEKLQRRAACIIMKTYRSDDALKFLK